MTTISPSANPLSELRSIHLPPPIHWWPLAPGWYLLILLIIITFVLIVTVYYKHKKKQPQRYALLQLATLRHRYQQGESSVMILAGLSTLLRRVALLHFPREQIAGLHGKAWLEFLDAQGNTDFFTQGDGQVLISAPYQSQSQAKIDALFEVIEQWLKNNL